MPSDDESSPQRACECTNHAIPRAWCPLLASYFLLCYTGPQHPSRVFDLLSDFEIGRLDQKDWTSLEKKNR